jgi:hypothetical protein
MLHDGARVVDRARQHALELGLAHARRQVEALDLPLDLGDCTPASPSEAPSS